MIHTADEQTTTVGPLAAGGLRTAATGSTATLRHADHLLFDTWCRALNALISVRFHESTHDESNTVNESHAVTIGS